MSGEDLLSRAEKKEKGFSFFGGSSKFTEAAELYEQAANQFKIGKNWEKSGNAFLKAANAHIQANEKHDASNAYCNASNAFKKIDKTDEAIDCLKKAIELVKEAGRFSMAAKYEKEIAEMYETMNDLENAMNHYRNSADMYEGENQSSSASGCLLKVAQFAAQLEKYQEAIEIFEKVADQSLSNNLLKYSVKEYFLKAILCHLCQTDMVGAQSALEKYQDKDPSFSQQRECKFAQDIIKAVQEYDVEGFTQVVFEYDSISKLDPWKTTILLRIKKSIKEQESSGLA